MDTYEGTDRGNGKRFADRHAKLMKYCNSAGRTYLWTGGYWEKDVMASVIELAQQMVHEMYIKAQALADEDERKKWTKFALQSQSLQRIRAMIEIARSDPRIACRLEDFDRNKEYINCRNCTVDITTGVSHAHRMEDMITKIVDFDYDQEAKCPAWRKHILDIMCGDVELAGFLQTVIGYALTGYTSEDKLFILYGSGANGKTTLFDTLKVLFKDYVCIATPGLLLATRNERHPVELADLYGARMVITSETNKGIRFDEAKIKSLTGRDWIKGRYLFKDFFEFMPTHTILLSTNNRAEIDEDTEAMWRRIAEIPFKAYFAIGAPGTIGDYCDILVKEGPGILNWVIEGAMEWRRHGLKIPDVVKRAVADYRHEQSAIERFIEECCEVAIGQSVKAAVFYGAYCTYCRRTGRTPETLTKFGELMTRKFDKVKTMNGAVYRGVGLVLEL